ncbi:integrase, catalytic region, zinc finger, CCHC-type containing protein [Tanacetum coccineum]
MATMAENVIAAGAENRPPMLEKGMYDSWKSRILLYIEGKENSEMLIDSIKHSPFKLKEDITIPATEGTNIILLGLPVDIYTLVNHHKTTKEIWDRVKELMEGTELTLQERESNLYDDFDRFTYEKGESIHSYYWRYAKLINDMNIIGMTMTPIQVNTKFVNHLQPEWSRHFSNTMRMMLMKFEQCDKDIWIHLPYLLTPKIHLHLTSVRDHRRQSQGYAVNTRKSQATGIRVINTIGDVKANQLRAIRCYNCKGEGHIAKQCTAKKRVKDSKWFKEKMLLAQAQESRVILHEEQQEFLADRLEEMENCDDLQLHTTSNFKADHVDAYDSD